MTDSQLNMSWTVAAAKALRNSLRSPICVRETIVLVTEVPMLAPMTIGMATRTVRTARQHTGLRIEESHVTAVSTQSQHPKTVNTDLQLAETMLTMMDDDVDELCTNTVVKIPIITPTTGFCNRSFCWKISPVKRKQLD